MKVLVAEDNADSRQLIEDILIGSGYETLSARDGHEAIACAKSAAPDLIILDVNMPGLNGFEVCAHIKSHPETLRIPVLMLTALADVENRVTGLSLGADDYITKPFNPRELLARVQAHLRTKVETDKLRATQRQIRQTFERYVSPNVVERLLETPDQVKLGGQLQEITVLFIDLEGFSRISEHTEPADMLDLLNRYHSLMVDRVQEEEGTIDKFLGDGLMTLFNTPLPQPNHALHAARAAMRIKRALANLQAEIAPRYPLQINAGIHTGQAIVGNVGTDTLMDFTAIGDAVNVASRLQAMAEQGQVLVSQSVYEQVKPYVVAECLGPQTMKNRDTSVIVYELREMRL